MDLRFLLVLCIPLAIDILSCALGVRRAFKGRGPSGVPVITLFLYGYLIWSHPTLSPSAKAGFMTVAICIHVLLVFIVPMVVAKARRAP